jgi:hypothetical protein
LLREEGDKRLCEESIERAWCRPVVLNTLLKNTIKTQTTNTKEQKSRKILSLLGDNARYRIWIPGIEDFIPEGDLGPLTYHSIVTELLTMIDEIYVKFTPQGQCDFFLPSFNPKIKKWDLQLPVRCTYPKVSTSICVGLKPQLVGFLPISVPVCIPFEYLQLAHNLLTNFEDTLRPIGEALMNAYNANLVGTVQSFVDCGGSNAELMTLAAKIGSALGNNDQLLDISNASSMMRATAQILLDAEVQQAILSLNLDCMLREQAPIDLASSFSARFGDSSVYLQNINHVLEFLRDYFSLCDATTTPAGSVVNSTIQLAGTIFEASAQASDPLSIGRNEDVQSRLNQIPWGCLTKIESLPVLLGTTASMAQLPAAVGDLIYSFMQTYFITCQGSPDGLFLFYNALVDVYLHSMNVNVFDLLFKLEAKVAGCIAFSPGIMENLQEIADHIT